MTCIRHASTHLTSLDFRFTSQDCTMNSITNISIMPSLSILLCVVLALYFFLKHEQQRRKNQLKRMIRNPGGKPSILEMLSPDLILEIADYLPRSSLGALSLTCRDMHEVTRKYCAFHLKALSGAGAHDNLDFLRLLERDYPDHIACYYCQDLHPIADANRYRPTLGVPRNSIPSCVSHLPLEFFINEHFSYAIFQMIMTIYRRHNRYYRFFSINGPEWDTIRRLFETFSRVTINTDMQGYRRATITSCSLPWWSSEYGFIVRTQGVFLIPPSQEFPWPWRTKIFICPHQDNLDITADSFEGRVARQLLALWDQPHHPYFWGEGSMVRCIQCYTEWRIDFQRLSEGGGFKMCLTIWKALGKGVSPHDPAFRRHVDFGENTYRTRIEWPSKYSLCRDQYWDHPMYFKFWTFLDANQEQSMLPNRERQNPGLNKPRISRSVVTIGTPWNKKTVITLDVEFYRTIITKTTFGLFDILYNVAAGNLPASHYDSITEPS
jgi:hypothetical protein